MGTRMSKINRTSSSSTLPPSPSVEPPPPPRTISSPNFGTNTQDQNPSDGADLSSYEAACRADPDLRNFDSNLQLRTSRAINSISVGLVEVRSLSIDSLRDATECLLETNQEALRIFLQNKKDIWNNKELSDLVDDYFQNSLLTLDFCNCLNACVKRAGHIESIINVSLRKFEEEHLTGRGDYTKTLEELRNFKGIGDPFTQEFFNAFTSVHFKQSLMLEKLQLKKQKLDKSLGKLKAWRKVSNVIFIVAFASVLICSVVAAAISAPPVVTALAAAAAVPLGSMGRWINSYWSKYEKELRGQNEIISSMEIGSYVIIKDLDSIRILVEKFKIEVEALLCRATFALEKEEEAVVISVADIKKKVGEFVKTIHDLNDRANKCSQQTRMARTMVLRSIINQPGSSSNQDSGMFF